MRSNEETMFAASAAPGYSRAERLCKHVVVIMGVIVVLSTTAQASLDAAKVRTRFVHTRTGGGDSENNRVPKQIMSYWEHSATTTSGRAEIRTMPLEYTGKHPHHRYLYSPRQLAEIEEISKFGDRPNDDQQDEEHDSPSEQVTPNNKPSPLLRNDNGDANIVPVTMPGEPADDDFVRDTIRYEHTYDNMSKEQANSNNDNSKGSDDESYQPIRIRFITQPLEERRGRSAFLDKQIDQLLETSLPEAASIWSRHLSVYPVSGDIRIDKSICYGSFASFIRDPILAKNTDLAIIVSAYDELSTPDGDTVPVCGAQSLALGAACALDQYDRPIVGFINLCLRSEEEENDPEEMDLNEMVSQAFQATHSMRSSKQTNYTSSVKSVNPTEVLVHELAHTLGFDSYLYKFFRNGTTGEPLTPRPFRSTLVQCTNGDDVTERIGFPSSKILQQGVTEMGELYFNLVTPRVVQVARNHFGCQHLSGARLENYDSSCVGSHWDERLFLMDILSPALSWTNNYLSPLTLALMEDTGWYQVNYKGAITPTFGLGAGCDFVEGACIVNDRVTSATKDYFCDNPIRLQGGTTFDMEEESFNKITCDPSHHYWAMCDLWDASTVPAFLQSRFPEGRTPVRYFSDSNLEVSFPQADFCPVAHESLGVDCSQEDESNRYNSHQPTYLGEETGPESRCINAFSDISVSRRQRVDRPACMHVECDAEARKLILGRGSFRQVCDFDGQVLLIPESDSDYLECPRLSSVCPHLFCPAGCSGRGVCDYDAKPHPKCNCFDPENDSLGCYHDHVPQEKGTVYSSEEGQSVENPDIPLLSISSAVPRFRAGYLALETISLVGLTFLVGYCFTYY